MYSYGPPCLWRAIYFEIEGNGRRFTPGILANPSPYRPPNQSSAPDYHVLTERGKHIKISNKYKNGWNQPEYVLLHFQWVRVTKATGYEKTRVLGYSRDCYIVRKNYSSFLMMSFWHFYY